MLFPYPKAEEGKRWVGMEERAGVSPHCGVRRLLSGCDQRTNYVPQYGFQERYKSLAMPWGTCSSTRSHDHSPRQEMMSRVPNKPSQPQEGVQLQDMAPNDLDGKESIHHMETPVLSLDPKVAALQGDIELLIALPAADYDIVHSRLVRKVSRLFSHVVLRAD